MTDSLSTQGAPAAPTQWIKPLTVMTLVQIAATGSILALTALAPEVAQSLGIGAHWIGYQISLIYFSGMFASGFAGAVVETLRAERVIRLELAIFVLGLLMLASGQPVLMVLASLLFGIGYGLNNPASSVILHRFTPRRSQSLVFSIKQSGVPLGAVLANVLLPALAVALGAGWRVALMLAALPPALLLLWSLLTDRPEPIQRGAASEGVWRRMLREQKAIHADPRLQTLALLGGLYSALQLIATAFIVVMLVEHGWTLVAAGSVAAASQLMGAIGRVAWGVAADRLGGFRTLALIGLIAGGILFSLYWIAEFPAALQVILLAGLGGVASGWNGVFLAAAARTAPQGKVGANTGALLVYTFIGVIIGPSCFAFIYGMVGDYGLGFTLFSAVGFFGALLSWRQVRAQARAGQAA
ncbi:MFS transporter [Salipiger sp. PrR002]|uniref:MFS transporter n=1 Tax=Salipiger sp. PrR002 TaxID=2706489 RepID=UPI0013BC2557|nr:MFS transporter [Salipiger sp. PrR002]NDV98577.1 MFS transporter [Salipiger sp. PrR002]NDW57412.1 MFS transporter [Salipiger sp. PrR004]